MASYLLQSYLDARSQASPDKPALIDDQGALCYGELHDQANRMAHALRNHGVKRQERVAIWMKRSSKVVMALLGTLKADAIYVPVDAKAPVERLIKVVADCGAAALICEESQLAVLQEHGARLPSLKLLLLFGGTGSRRRNASIPTIYWDELSDLPSEPDRYQNIDADAAYILYTSGSTGTPKGVTVSHLNVINYIDWAVECFGIGADDVVLGTAPFHFDMSTFDIYTTLKAGATLCIASDKRLLFPGSLLDLIEMHEVTVWKGVSSLLMYLSSTGALKPERIPTLSRVLFGGEVLPAKHLMNWMALYPGKQFFNVYGPTETTGISAYHRVEKPPASANDAVPIGRACSNTEIIILNDDNRPARIGETGELCIRGSGLSLGYWNDEEKTSRAFVHNPLGYTGQDRIYRTGDLARLREDGLIEYLGRKDFQVKFMGYRIEIFEVEQAIMALEEVHHAAVLLCDSPQSEVSELVAFVEGPQQLDQDSMLQTLGRSLPSYMIPKQIIPMQHIPLSDRGKTDRGALRDFYRQYLDSGKGGGL